MSQPFKSGFVALVGRPNVGKSTLINHLIGEKVAIVSAKAQTTRNCLQGILTLPERAQMVFVDTPGIHKPQHLLTRFIVDQALFVLGEVDHTLFLVDATEPPGPGDQFIARALEKHQKRTYLVLNKIDKIPKAQREAHLAAYQALGDFAGTYLVSAKHSDGLPQLLDALVDVMPEGEQLYPDDEYTDQTQALISAELIREQVFRCTGDEIPHAATVYIEQFKERTEDLTYIAAVIAVERDTQKRIMIGKQGQKLKEIGAASRQSLEYFLGTKVFLELFVKVIPDWRNQPARLRQLGYQVK